MQFDQLKRREFLSLLGVAMAWPLTARAQQPERMRRIGVLMAYAENDRIAQSWIAVFRHGLGEAGWVPGRNVQIEYRWTNADVARIKQFANELVTLKPDLILANTTPVTAALKRETSTIPIVFVVVNDPVGAGFVESLPRPAGNMTGFLNLEGTMGGKWLGLLKEVAPNVTHAAIMFNPDTAPGAGSYSFPSFEMAGRQLGVTASAAPVRNPAEIERAIADLAAGPGGGLVTESDAFLVVHLKQVIALTEAYKVPAVHGLSAGARQGGLLSYTPDIPDMFGRSAVYVDRILKGEKPADLPVQAPTKFNLVINLKTAKSLGLTVPPTLLATADEVIE